MVDNSLYTGKHGLDPSCDNYPSDISATQTDNVAADVNITPDGASAKLMQLQTQMEGATCLPMLQHESDRVVEVPATESDIADHCSKGESMSVTQTGTNLATSLVSVKDELGDTAGKGPTPGDIVAQHGPLDIEAQEYKRLCTVPEGLKEFPVYRALMMATAVISLVLTGYYGAKSSK